MTLAQHSVESYEWGTPTEILDAGREILGGEYDLDPCSSAYWNHHTVRAKRFIDVVEDGTRAQWNCAPGMRIVCNPASFIVDVLFRRCMKARQEGAATFWIGFSLEQVAYLQDDGLFGPELVRCRMVPRSRIAWLQGVAEQPQLGLFGEPPALDVLPAPVPQKSPTHSNYIALLPESGTKRGAEQRGRFEMWAAREGSKCF